jgi:type IV pilus assembly protein PilA
MTLRRRGFTLIELLIVVVIIGILAAIAIPAFGSTKEKAFVATLKTDLRNLATVEEGYYFVHMTYADLPDLTFNTSARVTVKIESYSSTGWSAVASHDGTKVTCSIGVGTSAPTGHEGDPVCT